MESTNTIGLVRIYTHSVYGYLHTSSHMACKTCGIIGTVQNFNFGLFDNYYTIEESI